jgi:hypothetical protein
MNNLDIKKAMTLEEVKNFFSGCGEYKVEKADEYGLMEITYTNFGKKYSILAYVPNVPSLIRTIRVIEQSFSKM